MHLKTKEQKQNSFKAVKLKLIIFGVKASVIDFKKTPIIPQNPKHLFFCEERKLTSAP